MPTDEELDWLSAKYPDTFDKHYRPRYEYWRELQARGERFYNPSLPMLCQVCQIPLSFTEPDDATRLSHRSVVHAGERYHFCSDGCCDIFTHEPEKYVQAWLPVHQILQGNCGGGDVESVVRDYYNIAPGEDNFEYQGSPEHQRWQELHRAERKAG
ncbi:YHS domain protein [compost metagenome]